MKFLANVKKHASIISIVSLFTLTFILLIYLLVVQSKIVSKMKLVKEKLEEAGDGMGQMVDKFKKAAGGYDDKFAKIEQTLKNLSEFQEEVTTDMKKAIVKEAAGESKKKKESAESEDEPTAKKKADSLEESQPKKPKKAVAKEGSEDDRPLITVKTRPENAGFVFEDEG
jgi:hypothetical protein